MVNHTLPALGAKGARAELRGEACGKRGLEAVLGLAKRRECRGCVAAAPARLHGRIVGAQEGIGREFAGDVGGHRGEPLGAAGLDARGIIAQSFVVGVGVKGEARVR